MNSGTKIQLSPLEMELVKNSDWILTKNGIIQKARSLLEQLQSRQLELVQDFSGLLPTEVTKIPPKISRGENYKGLPYLVLDYPRYFDNGNYFAIRCLFWWGNFFSITLHLSGIYKNVYAEKIAMAFEEMKKEGFSICIGEHEWEHHFEATNYLPLNEISTTAFNETLYKKKFVKLAKTYPLEQWDIVNEALLSAFIKMISWLTD